jgi:hypothetical protein
MSPFGRFCCESRLRQATNRDSVVLTRSRRSRSLMGRVKSDQGQLFYEFHLGDAVPEDHLVRKIDAALDLSWLRSELAPHYSSMGRPSIDPELMIRMLVVGYVFAIRSERLICREVQVNLAYLSANSASRTIQRSRGPATSASAREMFFVAFSNVSSRRALRPVWLVVKALPLMRA